jgi:serine protease Do
MPRFVRSAGVFLTTALLSFLIIFPNSLIAGTHSGHSDWSGGSGWLGISIQDITEGIKEASGLQSEEGVLVNEVVEGSPAEKSGMKAGDVVLKYDGVDILDSSQFVKLVRETDPAEEVKISLLRDGKEKDISVEVGERPEKLGHHENFGDRESWILKHEEGFPFSFDIPKISGGHIGVLVEDMNPQLAASFGIKEVNGALVLEANEDGPAYEAGIRGGDIILKVDDMEIDDTGKLRSAIRKKEKGEAVELTVIRKKKRKTFKVTVDDSPGFPSLNKKIEIFKLDDELGHLEDIHLEVQGVVHEELAKLKEEMEALKEELEVLKDNLKGRISN